MLIREYNERKATTIADLFRYNLYCSIFLKNYPAFSELFSPPASSSGISFFSPAIRYSSEAHLPRSISLHRSEQNGLNRLSSQLASFLHVGHVIVLFFIILDQGNRVAVIVDRGNHVPVFYVDTVCSLHIISIHTLWAHRPTH